VIYNKGRRAVPQPPKTKNQIPHGVYRIISAVIPQA